MSALTIDRRNLVDMESYLRDQVAALKRHIEAQDADIDYLHGEIIKREQIIKDLTDHMTEEFWK